MSYPQAKIRQPGRTAQKYDPGNCGVCDASLGFPTGSIGLTITGTGACCSPNLDSPPGDWVLTPMQDPCARDSDGNAGPCAWQYSFTGAGFVVVFTFTLSCKGGVPHFDLVINAFDTSNDTWEELASGQYTPAGSCGSLDCSTLFAGTSIGGALTLNPTNICSPSFCTAPTWSVTASSATCPQPAHKSCCCGGTPAVPCTDCCGDEQKTAWDVDLTGATIHCCDLSFSPCSGGCWTSDGYRCCSDAWCATLPDVYTLTNSASKACTWNYSLSGCYTEGVVGGGFTLQFQLTATVIDDTHCLWTFSIFDTGCNSSASWNATVAKGSCGSPITLTYVAGSTPICYVVWPTTITVSPA